METLNPFESSVGEFILRTFFLGEYNLDTKSFKQNTLDIIHSSALAYKAIFIDKEYLIYSSAFTSEPFYVITGSAKNFYHLTGVNSKLYANIFFKKAREATLTEDDIEIVRTDGSNIKSVIRDKRSVLPQIDNFFNQELYFEENFSMNKVHCKLATSDGVCTIGFVKNEKCNPLTLLKGNKISTSNKIDLILSMPKNEKKFSQVEYGDLTIIKNIPDIIDKISQNLKDLILT